MSARRRKFRQRYAKAAHDEAERVRSEFDDWRRETLAAYAEKLNAGRAPLVAVAADREATRQALAALRDRLIDGLEGSASLIISGLAGSVSKTDPRRRGRAGLLQREGVGTAEWLRVFDDAVRVDCGVREVVAQPTVTGWGRAACRRDGAR